MFSWSTDMSCWTNWVNYSTYIKIGGNIEKAGKKLSAFSAATSAALIASAKSAIDFEKKKEKIFLYSRCIL
mgnify:CR=1 FL=1